MKLFKSKKVDRVVTRYGTTVPNVARIKTEDGRIVKLKGWAYL